MINILDLHNKLINKDITAKEITEQCINKIERYDTLTNSIILKTYDFALNKAKEVDRKIEKKEDISIIAGIPFGVKDNLETKGVTTTAGSLFYEKYKPEETARCVTNLLHNDGVMLGKLNLDEFGVGDITKSFKYLSKNPYNLNYDASGSSGGSSIFVSAGFGAYSIGTDTGGSIREPAGKTGVVGIKPTYNCISKKNCYGYANSLDTIGSIATNVTDLAISMEFLTKYDESDKNLNYVDYTDAYKKIQVSHREKIRIGVLKEVCEFEGKKDEEAKGYFDFVTELKKSDAFEVVEVSFPLIKITTALYRVITAIEGYEQFTGTLKKYHNVEDIPSKSLLFDKRVRQRILMGEYYKTNEPEIIDKAYNTLKELREDYQKLLKDMDFLLTPLTSFKRSQNFVTIGNFTMCPSVALPIGVKSDKVPFGVQIFGKYKEDVELLKFAYILEKFIGFKERPTFDFY
ncbi:MAG: amidase [Lachnospirales bacterium]